MSWVQLLACLLTTCLLNEGVRESSSRQAIIITPARHDEGTVATKHNAATGERGCHNNAVGSASFFCFVFG